MNTLPFPPVVLTYITMDNALSHEACRSGLKKFIKTHHLSNLTAVPVVTLLKSKQLTSEATNWVKSIAGLSIYKHQYGNEYGNGYGHGSGYGYGLGNGNGSGYEYGYGDGITNGNGEGYGNGYGLGYGNGDGYGYGDGITNGDGCGDDNQ